MAQKSEILENLAERTLKLRRSHSAYCFRCEKIVELFTFQDAATCFNTDRRDIEFLSDRLMLHRIHNSRGEVMICTISLFELFETRATRLLDDGLAKQAAN